MKTRNLLLLLAAAIPALSHSQGTLADYQRAYSLYDKFKADNVYHWARNVAWKDSSSLVGYDIQTAEGRQWITYDAVNGQRNVFANEADHRKAMGMKTPRQRKPAFGRQHQRHWMEVDEENTPRPVASPDGKTEAYIEEYNLVLHEVGKPYFEKRVLTQDGTIGL